MIAAAVVAGLALAPAAQGQQLQFLGSTIATGVAPQNVTVADVNGDGRLDIVSADRGANAITMATQDSSGAFNPVRVTAGNTPVDVAIADFNGDGQQDFVTANSSGFGQITVGLKTATSYTRRSLNLPAGSSSAGEAPTSVAVADLDADGRPDIITNDVNNDRIVVFYQRTLGSYTAETIQLEPDSTPAQVKVADLNDDGRLDLAAANAVSRTVSIAVRGADGAYAITDHTLNTATDIVTAAQQLAIADLNGDGRLDLAVINAQTTTPGLGTVSVLTKDAAGSGYTTSLVGPTAFPLSVAVGDVSGDGRPDIVVPNRDPSTVTIFAAGPAGYAPTAIGLPQTLSLPVDVEVADLDGDGRQDIVTANINRASISVLRNVTFQPVPAGVGGTVPATLSLSLGAPATFSAFTPGLTRTYTATTSATITSTAGDATLTYSDPGRLANGTFTLAQPLQVALSRSSWAGPTSNDAVTITFTQPIGANDPLRTGTYSRTLTFSLSTTSP